MEFDLIIILLGVLVLGAGVYFKFMKSDSSSEEQQPKQEEKKKREITYGQIKLFYGSQSGTANKLAGILEEEAQQNFFDPEVYGVEKFEEQITPNKPTLAIFLMATHGEGDPTDNAIQFMKWMKSEDRTDQDLNNMQFIVFGLGNTQYEHYNLMGRNTNKFLEKLGAKPLYQYGEGDDNSTLEDDFNDWKEDLWNQLKQIIEPKPYVESEQQNQQKQEQQNQKQQQNMQPVNLDNAKIQEGLKYDFQTEKFLQSSIAFVRDIREIRENTDGGSTLHMEIDLSKANLEYKTAQNLGIFVENDQKLVVKLAEYLKVDLNTIINNPAGAKNQMFPAPLTVREVLTYFCDFQGQLMKKTLKDLAKICTNEANKSKLELMASAKGKQLFKEEIENNKETIFGLLQKFEVVPTLDQFLLMTPRLSPRVFTISSSSLLHKNIVHVTDSLLVDDLPGGGKKVGVCSQYFDKINRNFKNGMMNQKIRVDFRESSFKLPQDQTPVIMVGAGTGVAPFIAFAQEKSYLVQKGINIAPGEFTLYFGCRNENKDFIFKDQIKQWVDQKIINKLYTAFSRDSDKKVYVQDKVMENQDEVYETLFEKKGTLFICGSMGMGKSVVTSVQKIIQDKQNLSEQESAEFIKKMEEERKLIKELW